jgi:hypothetical protein
MSTKVNDDLVVVQRLWDIYSVLRQGDHSWRWVLHPSVIDAARRALRPEGALIFCSETESLLFGAPFRVDDTVTAITVEWPAE